MYKYKRLAAYLIDVAIVLLLVRIASGVDFMYILYAFSQGIVGFEMTTPFSFAITALIPILLYGIMVGQYGCTPGKYLMKLRIRNMDGEPIGLGKGILRETIKCGAISVLIFGLIWAIHGIFTKGKTFYDRWLELSVDDLVSEDVGNLNDIQKRWRDFHDDN